MPAVLIALYAVLVHLAVLRESPLLQWAALVVLCALPQAAALRAGRPLNWALLAALAAILYVLARAGGGLYVLFLPPIVWPAVFLAAFAVTLRPGAEPLVSRMARISRGGRLPAELVPYTRSLTWLWTGWFVAQICAAVALALFAPLSWWSAWTNFLSYAAIAALLVLEYLWRRWRYRHLPHQTFAGYLRSLVQTRYRAA